MKVKHDAFIELWPVMATDIKIVVSSPDNIPILSTLVTIRGHLYWRWLLPGTWSHLWCTGVHECPPWCSIVGAAVTVHQFFCILHYKHCRKYLPIFKRFSNAKYFFKEIFKFSRLKVVEIVIFGIYYTIHFGFSLFLALWWHHFLTFS